MRFCGKVKRFMTPNNAVGNKTLTRRRQEKRRDTKKSIIVQSRIQDNCHLDKTESLSFIFELLLDFTEIFQYIFNDQ